MLYIGQTVGFVQTQDRSLNLCLKLEIPVRTLKVLVEGIQSVNPEKTLDNT